MERSGTDGGGPGKEKKKPNKERNVGGATERTKENNREKEREERKEKSVSR